MSFFTTQEFGFMKFVAAIVCSLAMVLTGAAYADAAAGKSVFAARGCIGCHGAGGVSVVPTYPSLKGKDATFVSKNLTDFRSGARKNPVMNAMAAGLSDDDIRNLADYIDSLK
jgi:cytochrome c553